MRRFLFSCTLAAVLFAAAPANAQSLGTFRWRLADFCSVVNVNVIQQGSFYQLVGYEEQCGGNPRLPVYRVGDAAGRWHHLAGIHDHLPVWQRPAHPGDAQFLPERLLA